MRLLLDTHVFLWVRTDDRRLSPEVRRAIVEADVVLVSAASAWEMTIKAALGQIELRASVTDGIRDPGFQELLITAVHAEAVAHLPRLHGDPFDRLLVAQASLLGLTLVTADAAVRAYPVPVLWAG